MTELPRNERNANKRILQKSCKKRLVPHLLHNYEQHVLRMLVATAVANYTQELIYGE